MKVCFANEVHIFIKNKNGHIKKKISQTNKRENKYRYQRRKKSIKRKRGGVIVIEQGVKKRKKNITQRSDKTHLQELKIEFFR